MKFIKAFLRSIMLQRQSRANQLFLGEAVDHADLERRSEIANANLRALA